MKLRKLFSSKLMGAVNCLALMLVVHSASAACIWYFHQPEFPESANKFKKVQ